MGDMHDDDQPDIERFDERLGRHPIDLDRDDGSFSGGVAVVFVVVIAVEAIGLGCYYLFRWWVA